MRPVSLLSDILCVFVTFQAEGVGVIFNSPLDSYPMAFRRDLIIHDAHRHPWIERLGTMYMMKLQHGRTFGSRAGAAWRIIFTLALFPWLRKHRQLPPILLDDESTDATDGDKDMYGLDSLQGQSVRIRNRRRQAMVVANDMDDPVAKSMVMNQSLVFENNELRRQVMELQNRLNRESRRSVLLNRSLRSSVRGASMRPTSLPANLQ